MSLLHNFDLVIFHSNCPDGSVSAWIYHLYLKKNNLDEGTVQFVGMPAGKYPQGLDLTDKKVLLLDYSFKRQEFINASEVVKELLMLDHHRSAVTETKDLILPRVSLEIDEKRCGAQMAWDYFFHGQPRPWFIEVVADRDLWKNEYPRGKELASYLHHTGIYYDFTKIDTLYDNGYGDITTEMITIGETYMSMEKKNIGLAVKYATSRTLTIPSGKIYNIMLTMCSHTIASEVGNHLALLEGIDFAICYRYNFETDEWFLSCRGTDKVNLSELTREYGGGGHFKASGFSVKNNANVLQTMFPVKIV